MKKILFIYPSWTENYYSILNPARLFSRKYSIYPPLNLAYLATIAENNNYEVKIHDGELNNTSLLDYYLIIKEYKPDIVGLTAFTPSFKFAEDVANLIKINFKNIKVLIGGVHYSAMNEENDYLPEVFDYGFVGKSLTSFQKFLQEDYPINNIFRFDDNDSLIENILPARHLLENKKYRRPTKFGVKNFTTIFASIGCPFKCIFCSNKNQKIIYREIPDVIEEIKQIQKDYNIEHFIFLDDTLTINKNKTIELCEEILRNNIKITFEGSTRANLVDDKLMSLLARAGMIGIAFGLETADEEMREKIKKNVKTSSYIKANSLANKYDMLTQNSCIVGLPGETIDSIKKTLLFLRNNHDIKQANISVATPYPGTELYRMAKNNEGGLKLLTEDYSKYKRYGSAVMDSGELKAKDLVKIQEEAFASIYFPRFRWKYTIQRSGVFGLLFDLFKIFKLIVTGRTRFLFDKNLRRNWNNAK
jgi:anaerobic magnesium-protoporphyrin IX monomethyl ester cyclase